MNDEQVLFLTDIFPTGYTGVDWANISGGETVAIFGSGPVGIMAAKSAWLRGAGRVIMVDTLPYRLAKAKEAAHGPDTIVWQDDKGKDVIDEIRAMTNGRGVDVCIEAVGFEPERNLLDRAKAVINMEKGSIKVLEACMSSVRRGGFISVLGVYPVHYDNFPLGQLFDKGLTIRGGQAPVHQYIDQLLEYVQQGKVRLDDVITHRMPLSQVADGYAMFKKKEDDCVKIVLNPAA